MIKDAPEGQFKPGKSGKPFKKLPSNLWGTSRMLLGPLVSLEDFIRATLPRVRDARARCPDHRTGPPGRAVLVWPGFTFTRSPLALSDGFPFLHVKVGLHV
jgi:hypothetical protein